jgi:predicted HTH transcriptional regulator
LEEKSSQVEEKMMEYLEFLEILKKGNTITTAFMTECHAFKDSVKDDAELARDIIAMANNGNTVSYLVIGVSDDGRIIKSVDNENLTDDNLQVFCMENIFPPPAVKLSRFDLTDDINETNSEKTIVIIQIGPQPHQ